jgi:hypothetical protein
MERDLGLEADASYGRLRFAPRLPSSGGSVDVRGIRVGDSLVRVGISRSGATYDLRILQEGGRVPLNLVFSPWLSATEVVTPTVFLDGSQVEPRLRTSAEGTQVEMQFPLDRHRAVRIVNEPT